MISNRGEAVWHRECHRPQSTVPNRVLQGPHILICVGWLEQRLPHNDQLLKQSPLIRGWGHVSRPPMDAWKPKRALKPIWTMLFPIHIYEKVQFTN